MDKGFGKGGFVGSLPQGKGGQVLLEGEFFIQKAESHLGLLDDMEHDFKVSSDEAYLKSQRPTKKAAEFIAANIESGVVAGAAFEGGGGSYTLKDGRTFRLSLEDMRSMKMPRWDFGDGN